MRIVVVGSGYVGLVSGAGFADFGNEVLCVDVDERKIDVLSRGRFLLRARTQRPGAAQHARAQAALQHLPGRRGALGRGRLSLRGDALAPRRRADLSQVLSAARTIARNMPGYLRLLVQKSTVPVGTADKLTPGSRSTRPAARSST